MIGIKGSYAVQLDVAGSEDIQLDSLKIVASAGLRLPRFEISFRAFSERIVTSFSEGKTIRISVGRDSDSMKTCSFRVVRLETSRQDTLEISVVAKGILDQMGFLSHTGNFFSKGKVSGLEAIAQCLDGIIPVDSQPEKSEDVQFWYQPASTRKKFIQNCWLHSNLSDSAPLVAITADGELRIRSLADVQGGKTMGPAGDVAVHGNYMMSDRAGLNLTLAGESQGFYQTSANDVAVLEDGVLTSRKPFDVWLEDNWQEGRFSDGGRSTFINLNRNDSFLGAGRLTPNMDMDYWKSYVRNVTTLANFSSTVLTCQSTLPHFDLELLDGVTFLDPTSGGGSSPNVSGDYIITKLTQVIENKTFYSLFELEKPPVLALK